LRGYPLRCSGKLGQIQNDGLRKFAADVSVERNFV
jgi:hypothetical protein